MEEKEIQSSWKKESSSSVISTRSWGALGNASWVALAVALLPLSCDLWGASASRFTSLPPPSSFWLSRKYWLGWLSEKLLSSILIWKHQKQITESTYKIFFVFCSRSVIAAEDRLQCFPNQPLFRQFINNNDCGSQISEPAKSRLNCSIKTWEGDQMPLSGNKMSKKKKITQGTSTQKRKKKSTDQLRDEVKLQQLLSLWPLPRFFSFTEPRNWAVMFLIERLKLCLWTKSIIINYQNKNGSSAQRFYCTRLRFPPRHQATHLLFAVPVVQRRSCKWDLVETHRNKPHICDLGDSIYVGNLWKNVSSPRDSGIISP